ncbi:MAG: MFS transporter [Candidatus Bathyarchaeia archaeon]
MKSLQEFFNFFHGNVRVLVICRALWTLSFQIPSPFLTLYILALGGSPIEVGLVNSLAFLGVALYPIGGLIADRVGRVKLVGYATYFMALTYIFYIVAQDWRAIALGHLLHQMALFYLPALNAIFADSLPPAFRGRGFALERAVPGALGTVAPYLGGLLITHFGGGSQGLIMAMRICYLSALLVGLLVATLRLFFLKETLKVDASAFSLGELLGLVKEAYIGLPETIKRMPRAFHPIIYLEVILSFSVSMAAPFWILYATEVVGLTTLEWSTLLMYSGVFSLIFTIPAGYLVDRLGPKLLILLSTTLAVFSTLIFLFSPSFWGVFVALNLLAISNAAVMPSYSTLIANLIERGRRGRTYALIGERGVMVVTSSGGGMVASGLLLIIPASIGGLLGGYLYLINRGLPFILLAISLSLVLIITYRLVREPERPEV